MSNTKSSNQTAVPEAKGALDRFKFEVANELGVPLTDGYNGNLTSKQNGSVGGYMVKKIVSEQPLNFNSIFYIIPRYFAFNIFIPSPVKGISRRTIFPCLIIKPCLYTGYIFWCYKQGIRLVKSSDQNNNLAESPSIPYSLFLDFDNMQVSLLYDTTLIFFVHFLRKYWTHFLLFWTYLGN